MTTRTTIYHEYDFEQPLAEFIGELQGYLAETPEELRAETIITLERGWDGESSSLKIDRPETAEETKRRQEEYWRRSEEYRVRAAMEERARYEALKAKYGP